MVVAGVHTNGPTNVRCSGSSLTLGTHYHMAQHGQVQTSSDLTFCSDQHWSTRTYNRWSVCVNIYIHSVLIVFALWDQN